MRALFAAGLALGIVVVVVVAGVQDELGAPPPAPAMATTTANLSEEMHLIKRSFEHLLGELAVIRREANGRLARNRAASNQAPDPDQIRQVKVSRYVLRRVAELEGESRGMQATLSSLLREGAGSARQEDRPFEEPQTAAPPPPPAPSATTESPQTTTTTASQAEEEAAKIGFDVEALKKLGDELDDELAARQQQPAESVRGVHEQVIRLVDNMVQHYLANVRRTVQRMTQLLGNRRAQPAANNPRRAPSDLGAPDTATFEVGQREVLRQVEQLSKQVHEFAATWPKGLLASTNANKLQPRQQSPLIDRIPPRGVELWRDFWDTVRRQVRRINHEFLQLSRDMTRMITGRNPNPPPGASITISLTGSSTADTYPRGAPVAEPLAPTSVQQVSRRFEEFYQRMSATLGEEQLKMDSLAKAAEGQKLDNIGDYSPESLIDEFDDEKTREELRRNVGLRQQIRQEINVFSSIFDIMGAFIQRLRESANSIRNVVAPMVSSANNNDAVTPGPLVKPQIDRLINETLDSQRGINSQAKPVLLPNARPVLNPKA